ncbi:MAG: hypothetical protein JWO94_2881 [Verrucomicrobiaceae bacterium]|nr:hypothetical protein [Verrucomicrobiaceae bacterium]
MRLILCLALCLGAFLPARAETKTFTGPEYVAGVKAAKPKGGVYIRARLVQGKTVMQIQIKRRALPNGGSDQLYQVIFPKERKGESVLLHLSGSSISGSQFTPAGGVRPIGGGDRHLSVFGTDLTIEDMLADFYDWKQQTITGHESLGPVPCVVIESKPDHGGSGPSKAVSWIDEKRYVPMRVQVYDGGSKPARVVDTEKVIQVSSGYYLPVTFTVTNMATDSKTLVEGSSSKDGINYTDADFTEKAMQQVGPPPSGN